MFALYNVISHWLSEQYLLFWTSAQRVDPIALLISLALVLSNLYKEIHAFPTYHLHLPLLFHLIFFLILQHNMTCFCVYVFNAVDP